MGGLLAASAGYKQLRSELHLIIGGNYTLALIGWGFGMNKTKVIDNKMMRMIPKSRANWLGEVASI
jgi:hypothetical protein